MYKQTPEKVAEILTMGGFEVEEVVKWGQGLEQVIVGQIKTIISHAEANKLSVCKVDIGRKQPLTIVCGAKNVKPEQKVPVALVGTTLPNGMKIERRRIRGVDSEGMLCAEDELKLGEDHSGILILNQGNWIRRYGFKLITYAKQAGYLFSSWFGQGISRTF